MTSGSAARKRQRSTRLTVATLLLVLSAALVAGTAASGSWLLLVLAAAGAVVVGAAATRITHAELLQSRRDANRDRAEQAQSYLALDDARTSQNRAQVDLLTARLADRDRTLVARGKTIAELEETVPMLQEQVAQTTVRLAAETRRADELEREGRQIVEALEAAETRIVELEAELDVVTSAWQQAEATSRGARKHA